MIRVEPTRDKEFLWRIASHQDIYARIGGTDETDRESVLTVVDNPENYFLKGMNNDFEMGFFAFHRLPDDAGFDLHICLLPTMRGGVGLTAFRSALVWVFEKFPKAKILAVFSNARRDVKQFIVRTGFQFVGCSWSVCTYELEKGSLCLG